VSTTDVVERPVLTVDEIKLANVLIKNFDLEVDAANHCANMIKTISGPQAVSTQLSFLAKKPDHAQKLLDRCKERGWIKEDGTLEELTDPYATPKHTTSPFDDVPQDKDETCTQESAQGTVTAVSDTKTTNEPQEKEQPRHYDEYKVFGSEAAIAISPAFDQHKKMTHIMLNFAKVAKELPKINDMHQFAWSKGIRFSMEPTEAAAQLLVLQGKRDLLRSLSENKDGITHGSKRLETIKQDKSFGSIYMKVTDSSGGGVVGVPLNNKDRFGLSAYLLSHLTKLELFEGLSGTEIMNLADNSL